MKDVLISHFDAVQHHRETAMRNVVVTEDVPDFAEWGRPVITISPPCRGFSRPFGRGGREQLNEIRALILRETTDLPGFREMIDTIAWSDMR